MGRYDNRFMIYDYDHSNDEDFIEFRSRVYSTIREKIEEFLDLNSHLGEIHVMGSSAAILRKDFVKKLSDIDIVNTDPQDVIEWVDGFDVLDLTRQNRRFLAPDYHDRLIEYIPGKVKLISREDSIVTLVKSQTKYGKYRLTRKLIELSDVDLVKRLMVSAIDQYRSDGYDMDDLMTCLQIFRNDFGDLINIDDIIDSL